MCLSTEASNFALAPRTCHDRHVGPVLRGDGVMTRDVIVVILVREVQQQIIGARRDDWSKLQLHVSYFYMCMSSKQSNRKRHTNITKLG